MIYNDDFNRLLIMLDEINTADKRMLDAMGAHDTTQTTIRSKVADMRKEIHKMRMNYNVIDELDVMKAERDKLRAALDKSIPFVETLISLTPTGVQREHACDFNIMVRALIAELEEKNG